MGPGLRDRLPGHQRLQLGTALCLTCLKLSNLLCKLSELQEQDAEQFSGCAAAMYVQMYTILAKMLCMSCASCRKAESHSAASIMHRVLSYQVMTTSLR